MFSLTTISALSLVSSVAAQSSVAELVASLRLAPTEVDRLNLVSNEQFVFDFVNPNGTTGVTTGAGGHTVAATSENFAAVIGNGVSMTIGFLGPCGINSPHTHPRATEINFSVNTTLRGGVLVENGARFAEIDIRPGTATVFPQGAIHFEMNPSCEPAMFVAAFNGEDPGVSQVAQRYFGLPPDIVGATLGGLGVEEVAGFEALIPDNVALGTAECLARCGIDRGEQPTSQRQPRVPANAFPAGITTAYPAGATAGGEAVVTETDTYYYASASSSVATYTSEAPETTVSTSAKTGTYYSSAAEATKPAVYTSSATATYYSSAAASTATASSEPATGSSETGECDSPLDCSESEGSSSETSSCDGDDCTPVCDGEPCTSTPETPYYPPSEDGEDGDGVTIIIEEDGSQGAGPVTVNVYDNETEYIDPEYAGYTQPKQYADSSSWSIKKARRQAGYKFGSS